MNVTELSELEKVADKIKKLLALSQSPNEAEAMAAFAKAQEMLTRHNLSLADLGDSKAQQVQEEIVFEWQRLVSWKVILMAGVCQANYCFDFTRKNHHGLQLIILGRPINIASARIQFEYLMETIERLAKQTKGDACGGQSLRKFQNAFKLGAANRLAVRIIENSERQKREGIAATSESEQVTAIVVRSLYERLEAELKAYTSRNLKLKHGTLKPSWGSFDGFEAGQSAADSVSLHKQVPDNRQRYLPS
ncbi:DUF2786 domain-containing protein (plasmid) [Nostoc sp. UHCC 0302]|uniref:DUF2786 domain-containing protein n=1 Tax=Nostoc sp. UHCC 0302 TaxID=3134896 RepID=UPI00311C9C6C